MPSGWPEGQKYSLAIRNPHNCFGDAELRESQASVVPPGWPNPISGNFATVFELIHPLGKTNAVRCMVRHVPGQDKRYDAIAAALGGLTSEHWRVQFVYRTQGIRIRGQWYPIVKMELGILLL